MEENLKTQRNKMLSMWLRHKPERAGLTLSSDGWATIDDVLAAFADQEHEMSLPEIEEIIRTDPKGRFEYESGKIRARYGHSLVLEDAPHPGKPPAQLYFGTNKRYVPGILEGGLKPMKRQFVHLSTDRESAREVGKRRENEPAILQIAAHEAHEVGIQFYPRGKGVWMSDPIPVEFITLMADLPKSQLNTRPLSKDYSRKDMLKTTPGTPKRRTPRGGFTKKPSGS